MTVAMFGMPGGQADLEVIQYYRPVDESGIQPAFANTLGIRHIAFVVEDIDAIVARLNKKDVETFGEIQRYEDAYHLIYIRGPDGIIVEQAEQLK